MYNMAKNVPRLFEALLGNDNKFRISIGEGFLLADNKKEFNIPESVNDIYIRLSVPGRFKNIGKTYYLVCNWLY